MSKLNSPRLNLGVHRGTPEPIQIVNAERDGNDGVLVTFSDGTVAGYVVEELLELRPLRQWVLASTSPALE